VDVLEPSDLPGDVLLDRQGSRAMQVVIGESHTCVLLEGGRVRCWGTGSVSDVLDPAELPGDVDLDGLGSRAIQVTAGKFHTCALLEGGRVRCWGQGRKGELGIAGEWRVNNPSDIPDDV